MSKYSEFELTHSHFFTLFKSESFLADINVDKELEASFKHNLKSVISILSLPITLSTSRTKHYMFDKIYTSESIRNAPLAYVPNRTEEELKQEKVEGRKKALEDAKSKFQSEMNSKKGGEKFWEITFQFLEDNLRNSDLKLAAKEVLRQANVLLWTSFEVLVRDLVIDVLNNNPEKFKDFNIKSIPLHIIEQFKYDIKNHLGNIYAEQRDWSNLKTIKDSIKLIWPAEEEVHENIKSYDLHKINQRRHLIVHRKGIVDNQYNELTNDNFTIGEEIPISPSDLKDGLHIVKSIGILLLSISY